MCVFCKKKKKNKKSSRGWGDSSNDRLLVLKTWESEFESQIPLRNAKCVVHAGNHNAGEGKTELWGSLIS